MKHIVIRDARLNGWEYGMLRSFERAIMEETGAQPADIPAHSIPEKYTRRFGHGMRFGSYRKLFPKDNWNITADVGWYILMGPENYRLDMYSGWQKGIKTKILYLFDTMPSQYDLIKRLLEKDHWDVVITAFNDAVDDLEKLTGRKWHCIEQAADVSIFQPAPLEERIIHFSSYGRRYPALHEAALKFCRDQNLYYDYTTHDAKHPVVGSQELYRQYAWHLNHSLFTFSWPVELTNPARAGHLHPITCRWFEAAAAGTIIAGQAPANPAFRGYFGEDPVVAIRPDESKEGFLKMFYTLWERREQLYNDAQNLAKNSAGWSWNERAKRISSILHNQRQP